MSKRMASERGLLVCQNCIHTKYGHNTRNKNKICRHCKCPGYLEGPTRGVQLSLDNNNEDIEWKLWKIEQLLDSKKCDDPDCVYNGGSKVNCESYKVKSYVELKKEFATLVAQVRELVKAKKPEPGPQPNDRFLRIEIE